MKQMTSLERCQAVLEGQTPDFIPVVPQSFMYALTTAGMQIKDVVHNGKNMAKAHIISQEKYGYDACVIDFDDATIAEAIGAKVIFRDDAPAVVNEDEPLLTDLRQIYDLKLPDPVNAGRFPVWLEATRTLVDAIGKEVFVMGRADQGPFAIACLLRGTTNFMMDLMTEDKKLIDDVIDFCLQASIAFGKAQKDAGAHATSIGDALAGPNLISPEMYRDFALTPERKWVEAVQGYGIPCSLHICGNTNSIIEDMGSTGAKIIEIDWQLDMAHARKVLPKSTVIMGNVDPSFPMVLGTPAEVEEGVRKAIAATRGKGHFMSTGCAMGPNTPEANFRAMIAAARKYGSYEAVMQLEK